MVAAGRNQRPSLLRTGLVLSAAGLAGHLVCNTAFVGSAPVHASGLRGGLVQRAADAGENGAGLASEVASGADELWISDVSPKGKAVMKVYQSLKDTKDPAKVADLMNGLDSKQKLMLKSLLEAQNGQERPITTTDPEMGDSVPRLYKKYQQIQEDDEAVLAWRNKMEYSMLKDIQWLIERDQMELADAEAAIEGQEDQEAAEEAWKLFEDKFPEAAKNGNYQVTPTRREDIMYRFRRLKEHMEIDTATALEIVRQDGTPMVVDPLFVRRTWKAFVRCVGKEEALDIVQNHPGSLVVQAKNVEQKIDQIKMGSAVIGAFAKVGNLFGR